MSRGAWTRHPRPRHRRWGLVWQWIFTCLQGHVAMRRGMATNPPGKCWPSPGLRTAIRGWSGTQPPSKFGPSSGQQANPINTTTTQPVWFSPTASGGVGGLGPIPVPGVGTFPNLGGQYPGGSGQAHSTVLSALYSGFFNADTKHAHKWQNEVTSN